MVKNIEEYMHIDSTYTHTQTHQICTNPGVLLPKGYKNKTRARMSIRLLPCVSHGAYRHCFKSYRIRRTCVDRRWCWGTAASWASSVFYGPGTSHSWSHWWNVCRKNRSTPYMQNLCFMVLERLTLDLIDEMPAGRIDQHNKCIICALWSQNFSILILLMKCLQEEQINTINASSVPYPYPSFSLLRWNSCKRNRSTQ